MRRREFITLLGGAAAWPLAARAQQPGKLPTIGFMGPLAPSAMSLWTAAFVQRLRELGWIEERTIAIEYRWGEGRSERFPEIMAEFVRLKVSVIVTGGTGAVLAAKRATSVIPIVFGSVADPVGTGLVASRRDRVATSPVCQTSRPIFLASDFELLREVVPGLRRLAILANISNPANVLEMSEGQAAARMLGLEVVNVEIRRADDIVPALEPLKGHAEALYVITDALVNTNRVRINALALDARLPTMHGEKGYVEFDGLMSYGPNFPDLYRRAAGYVDKILRGARSADLPVEQPTKFELVINLKTARALGIEIPPTLLARADEVIE